ncbi:MAG: hypothetical protein ACRCWY_02175 [Cellulosilyticaceae bacterium]
MSILMISFAITILILGVGVTVTLLRLTSKTDKVSEMNIEAKIDHHGVGLKINTKK